MKTSDTVALAGYALSGPFVLYLPLFKRMWNRRDTRLFLVQETGVALVTAGWAMRGDKVGTTINGGYGVALAAAWVLAGRRARART